ncbi:uncharacterized protein DNG_05051 [Cephalotrichum gorgonifer]|uniref:Uncharacterized protein n=1 Tax=Cephalotrichum gorgonifer TaxID=2041049 RepID=A0AAE8MZR0_9PEZI|nr:uncharacterized protein DNG_05051 [Cephalotrichum gorgonifer]
MEDESTTTWAALGIAVVVAALVTVAAHALQQYSITNKLIRLCDSVVFGGLPGHGRRVWSMSQLRFRVVYQMPQVSLDPELWPLSAAKSLARIDAPLPQPAGAVKDGRDKSEYDGVGAASWASFCRVAYASCHKSIGYSFVPGDADRCPTDIPNVPMQIALRDVVAIGLMMGMECTAASFEHSYVTLRGAVGTITSSRHRVLGPMIHFTPRSSAWPLSIGSDGAIPVDWLWRTMGNCTVAGRHYNWRRRRWVQRSRARFQYPSYPYPDPLTPGTESYDGDDDAALAATVVPRKPQDGQWHLLHPTEPRPKSTYQGFSHTEAALIKEVAQPDFRFPGFSWESYMAPDGQRRPTYTRMALRYLEEETVRAFGFDYEISKTDPDHIIVRRWVSEPEQNLLWRHTRRIRDAREAQAREAQGAEESQPEKSHSDGSTTTPPSRTEDAPESADGDNWATGSDSSVGQNPSRRQGTRSNSTHSRGSRHSTERSLPVEPRRRPTKMWAPSQNNLPWKMDPPYDPAQVDWFWLSQTDIIPGFWATPWREFEQLTPYVCIGAIATFIHALDISFGDANGIYYRALGPPIDDTIKAMRSGVRTYPAYAYDAEGGVVCAGTYATVAHPAFAQPIPAVDLLGSYEDQVDRILSSPSHESCERRVIELMRLDAWLSLVGRMPEIRDGPARLLEQTPALVARMISQYNERFHDLMSESLRVEEYGKLGGAALLWLEDKRLSAAESLYALVAALRTAKVGQAVLTGSDTRMLITIFEKDVQVHMV